MKVVKQFKYHFYRNKHLFENNYSFKNNTFYKKIKR